MPEPAPPKARFVTEIEPQPVSARPVSVPHTPGPKNNTETCGYCKRKLPDHSPRCSRRSSTIAAMPKADASITPDYRQAILALRALREEIDAAIATLERLGRVR